MTDAQEPLSLSDYAANNSTPTRRCILCNVAPEIEEQARAGKAAGVTYRVIGEWLETITGEKPIRKGRLERHFQDGHTR